MSPILLAWIVAAVLRISLGSATVAAVSTTGIVLPLLEHSDVNVALVVLAIGAGSVILLTSMMLDSGCLKIFWADSQRNIFNMVVIRDNYFSIRYYIYFIYQFICIEKNS